MNEHQDIIQRYLKATGRSYVQANDKNMFSDWLIEEVITLKRELSGLSQVLSRSMKQTDEALALVAANRKTAERLLDAKETFMTVAEFLEKNPDACSEGAAFGRKYQTMREVWRDCERADWMLWVAKRLNLFTKKQSVKLAIVFAERVLPKFEAKYPEDKRPRYAIQAAKRWLKNPTKKNQNAAAYAAAYAAERKWQADKIRKLYGNPFGSSKP